MIHVIAHPAAIAIALFLKRLHAAEAVRRAVIQVFAPASEQGAGGIEELQQQTVSLLSFKSMPRAVFDAQLGFNVLARYGEEAPIALEQSELRIERHLASLLAGQEEGEPMLHIIFNMNGDARDAALPVLDNASWRRIVDTGAEPPQDIVTDIETVPAERGACRVEARSVVVLESC